LFESDRNLATDKASLLDLAKALKVSVSTVSRALSDHPSISEATKKKVWKLARQLNYHPNHFAAALRKGKSNIVAVMVPTIHRSFFASVVRGIETVMNKSGYNVMICQSNDEVEGEKQNIDALLRAQVEGLIVSLSRSARDMSHFDKIIQRGLPLVLFDRMLGDPSLNAVVLDDYKGAYLSTEHLIAQGCVRIAHFTGPDHLNIYQNRRQGYQDALRAHGLPPNEGLIYAGSLSLESGWEGVKYLMALPQPPDAIFSASDYAAVGAMQALKARGIRIPDEVALTGFGNELFTSFTEPTLTTVDQHSEQMGQSAARLFLDMLVNKDQPLSPVKLVLQPGLIVRDSSSRKKDA
jgi:LacI family transcriptional regulator